MVAITERTLIAQGRPQALVHEMEQRPNVIGRIRLGIQVLTSKGRQNQKAVKIYEDGVAAGLTFKSIERKIEAEAGITRVMRPENTEHLTLTGADFDDPSSVKTLMDLYGEDRGEGLKIYSLPVLFPYDDVLKVMPHRFAAYTASMLQFFSEYAPDGRRFCMKYAEPVKSDVSKRLTRTFGGRIKELREDEFIDQECDFERCPQFQDKKCSLDLNLHFLIPGLKGVGVVQAHSTSTIALRQWYATLNFVMSTRGSLRNMEFRLTKKLMDTSYINELGKMEKSKNWITILTADIELPKMILDSATRVQSNVDQARSDADVSANLLEHRPIQETMVVSDVMDDQVLTERHNKLLDYLEKIRNSTDDPATNLIAELKGYLKYLNTAQTDFADYAMQKYGEDWMQNETSLKKLVQFVSTSTETTLKMVLNA